jgi:hypothetical protein
LLVQDQAAVAARNKRARHSWPAQKNRRKALLLLDSPPKRTVATCYERRGYRLKFLKTIMIIGVLVSALQLGGCATQHKEAVAPAPTTAK